MTSFETQTSLKAQLHPIYSLLTRHQPQKFLRTKDPSVVKEWLELVENHMSLFEMSWEGCLCLTLEREVKFNIELAPWTTHISKAPYRMAPVELQEFKKEFQKLLDNRFIKSSHSSYKALILFVKKKDESVRMCTNYR